MRFVSGRADSDLNQNKRDAISERLIGTATQDPGAWIPDFILMFDRFFGEKHFRWRCFYRSILISVITFWFLIFLGASISFMEISDLSDTVLGMAALTFFLNGIMDYISLLETRVILNTSMRISFKILIDIVLTFILIFIWIPIIGTIAFGDSFSENFGAVLDGIIGNDTPADQFGNDTPADQFIVLVIVATSYTTSVWLWLHGIAEPTIRWIFRTNTTMFSWLNVEKKPFTAISYVMNFYMLLVGTTLLPVVWMMKD